MQLTSLKHGGIAWKKLARKSPTFLFAWRKVGWGIFNISVNQIGDFEKWQKIKSNWGEKLQCRLVLAKLISDF